MELQKPLNRVPDSIHHIHIMGICGTGMAALAGMLKAGGYEITGSDKAVYPPMSHFLEGMGIIACDGYGPENLEPRPDLVIVGNVITRINPEAQALAKSRLPYLSFPQALAHFFIKSKTSLVVTGTHGKTTTSSLLASCLHRAERDPSFMIGGIVRDFDANFRLGKGNHFVSEGDEYDTAFFDKESKFLHYRPNIAIITSVEFDHADIFEDLEAIKRSFKKFVSLLPKDGLIIAHLDDKNVQEVVQNAPCEVQGYGQSKGLDWCLSDIRAEGGMTHFKVSRQGKAWAELMIRLPGSHNCLNGVAVSAVLHRLGLPIEQIQQGLGLFGGIKRRQEVRGIINNITVIDDFAHHPTAVRLTLDGLHKAYPKQRLITLFEPRTNSSRRAIFQQDYVDCFDSSAISFIREPVPLDGVAKSDLFSSEQLAKDLKNRGLQAESCPNTDSILKKLVPLLHQGDVVAILSNGGFDNIHTRLLEILEESAPPTV